MDINYLDDEEPTNYLAEEHPAVNKSKIPVSKPKNERSLLQNLGDYESSLFLGLGKGAGDALASIGNIPSNAIEHLTGKQLYHIPHPDSLGKWIDQYYGKSTPSNIGKSIGEAIGGTAIPVGGTANKAYKTLEAVRGAKGVAARMLASGGAGGLTAAATNEGNRLESGAMGTGLGIAGGAIPEAAQGIGAGLRYLRAPSAQAAEREEQLGNLLHQTLQANQNVESSQLTAAERANQQHRTNLTAERQSRQNIQNLFPNRSQRELTQNQVSTIRHARNDMQGQFQQRYGDFNASGGGQKPIRDPYQENELMPHLQNIGVNKDSTRRMGRRLEPRTVDTSITREDGTPYRITIPAQNARVSDYVELMRETRDAAQAAFAQARQADRAQQLELRARGQALRNMSHDAQRRIDASLTPSEAEHFQQIQHDYGTYFAPFNESNTLRQIYYNGEYKPDLLHKMTTNTERLPLHDYLLERYPGYRQSHIESRFSGEGHPLHPENIHKQASKIRDLGRTEHEVWNIMSPEQRAVLTHHMNIAQQRHWIERFKESIGAKPIKRAINAVEESAVRRLNPRTRQALDAIEHAQNHEQELIRQAKLLKLPDAEMRRMQRQIAMLKEAGKVGSHVLGWSELHNIASKFIK